jgi:hypothetical protein
MLNTFWDSLRVFTESSQHDGNTLPTDQTSNRSSHRSAPLSEHLTSNQHRIYNPHPYTIYNEYPDLGESASVKLDKKVESHSSFAFKMLSRLAGLWFITVAAGSVVCSIPISAMGLPIILGIGIFCLVSVAVVKYIVRLWFQLLAICWKATKALITSPTHLIGLGISLFRKVTHIIFHRNTTGLVDLHPYPTFPPSTRRHSTASSKYTDKSFEGFEISFRSV